VGGGRPHKQQRTFPHIKLTSGVAADDAKGSDLGMPDPDKDDA
jgi:hypothetical protein